MIGQPMFCVLTPQPIISIPSPSQVVGPPDQQLHKPVGSSAKLSATGRRVDANHRHCLYMTCVDIYNRVLLSLHYFYIMSTICILNIVYYLQFFGCIKCYPLAGNQHLSSFILDLKFFFLTLQSPLVGSRLAKFENPKRVD